ncbi:hypothetical protein ACLOJK_037020, partial [Asimina triloba]
TVCESRVQWYSICVATDGWDFSRDGGRILAARWLRNGDDVCDVDSGLLAHVVC